ncbi:DNA/RNA helicase domain-containing protein [Dermacoccaceae bacterium W4C1]
MHLYRTSVEGFSPAELKLEELLAEQLQIQTGQRASAGERRSWTRSLPILRQDLITAGLGKVELLIEYRLPLTSKRADVVLAGVHPRTGKPSIVVVELKQWSAAERFDDSETLVRVPQYGNRGVLHPGLQVGGYRDYLENFNGFFSKNEHSLAAVAYLHNATDSGVHDLFDLAPGQGIGRVFTGQGRGAFVDFLQQNFAPSSGASVADALLRGRTAPSKKLLSLAAEEVREREQFVLLDEQRDAVEHVLHAVNRARRSNQKTAVIVSGGPGSGKSVIALSLLGELARANREVLHATGSKSFTQTLRKVAGHRKKDVQDLFKYFNSFMTAEPNDLDCLILDEAHRIRDTSVNRYTPKKQREAARPQVEELLEAARVPVFLLDQHQVVRPGEMGTAADIAAHAEAQGMLVERISLDDQFRCGGSQLYVEWVLQLLGLAGDGPVPWTGDADFDVAVADSPTQLEASLASRSEEGATSRIAAGYCWPWSDPQDDGTLVPDIKIGTWERPWNLKGERSVGGAPPAALWASDPAGFGQVGCVYTAQGFEYDHAGVILGSDFVWREGRWIAQRGENRDPDFRNTKRVSDERFDELVRNVYKVLLTRGMQSVTLFSVDPETNEFLKRLVAGGPL